MTPTSTWLGDPTGRDRSTWEDLLGALPPELRDLHFTPEYFDLHARSYGTPGAVFVYRTDAGTVFQPFLRRSLEGIAGVAGSGLTDLESAPGYGGPLLIPTDPGASPELAAGYQAALLASAAEQGFVSEFCRLHPIFAQRQRSLLPDGAASTPQKQVVVLDLGESVERLWSRIEERQRKAAAIARRRGVLIRRLEPSDRNLLEFRALYLRTMERKAAAEEWMFPESYFLNCRDCLGPGSISLFSAGLGDATAGSILLLHRFQTVYYHLSASDPDFQKLNATSLLLVDLALWARSAGYRFFHLGGGRTDDPEDSLLRFKDSFAKRTLPLYVYRRPLMPERFEQLVRERLSFEKSRGLEPKRPHFFPPYRRI